MTASSDDVRRTLRFAGGCGVASALSLLLSPTLPQPVGVPLWMLGFALLAAFLYGMAAPEREGAHGKPAVWVVAGASLTVGFQLLAASIERVANGLAISSPLHDPLHDVGGAVFTAAMAPIGVAILAIALAEARARVLPRGIGWSAAVVGALAVVNGVVLGPEAMWGLLAVQVWALGAGVTLLASRRRPAAVLVPATSTAH